MRRKILDNFSDLSDTDKISFLLSNKSTVKASFQILNKKDAIYCKFIHVYMLYIIFLLGDDTGWAPWMTFLGAVGMMSGHWSPPHVICSMVSHFPCGSPPVCKERWSRDVFVRGGSLNTLCVSFGLYSRKFCCANNNCDTNPHVLHIYLLMADKRFLPGTILVGPRPIRLLLTYAACTAVSFTFFFFFKNVSKLVLHTLPGPMCM